MNRLNTPKVNLLFERISLYLHSMKDNTNAEPPQVELEILLDLVRAFYDELKMISLIQQETLLENRLNEVLERSEKEEIPFDLHDKQPEQEAEKIDTFVEKEPEEIIEQSKEEITKEEELVEEVQVVKEEILIDEIPIQTDIVETEVLQIIADEDKYEKVSSTLPEVEEQQPQEEVPTKEETIKEEKQEPKVQQQPDLFNYIKTNDIGQMVQNVSEKIQSAKAEHDTPKVMADKFKQETPNIFESISTNDIANHLQQKSIKDLRELIGINEKFLFINDLFSGDMRSYNEFIMALNDCEDRTSVNNMLNAHKESRCWGENTFAYTSLVKIIERKYF